MEYPYGNLKKKLLFLLLQHFPHLVLKLSMGVVGIHPNPSTGHEKYVFLTVTASPFVALNVAILSLVNTAVN